MRKIIFLWAIAMLFTAEITARDYAIEKYFDRVTLSIDTNTYSYGELKFQGDKYLFFRFSDNEEDVEIRLYKRDKEPFEFMEIRYSQDFEIIDEPAWLEGDHYRLKLRLKDLFAANRTSVIFHVKENEHDPGENLELKLFPNTVPSISEYNSRVELFRGEEREIEIETKSALNFQTHEEWRDDPLFEYKLMRSGDKLKLHFRAKKQGAETFKLPLKVIKPYVNEEGELSNEGPEVEIDVTVKPGRLIFLNSDKELLFMEQAGRGRSEIQLDHHSKIELDRTYRVEDRQEGNGRLLAEITPKSILGNNKVLCEVITYAFHRKVDGYLYIKRGNKTEFMTNFNIVNKPHVDEVSLLRKGGDWTQNLAAYPGEEFELRIRGSGLSLTEFSFHPCKAERDTTRHSDHVAFYNIKVPTDIDRQKVSVFMNEDITQYELRIREYQRPADLDFVHADYGKEDISVTSSHFDKPVFQSGSLSDIILSFQNDSIDKSGDFYGKQYLDIEVRIVNPDNELADIQNIENVVVCPGGSSPRYPFYDLKDCNNGIINLNDHLLRKTYDMDDFSRIIITIRHKESKYSETPKKRKITIIAERKSAIDIQVSFPAGLLVKDFSESGIGNLTGISTSVLAQLSFYDPKRIGSKRPFKLSTGFIAFNAFNFRNDPDIDRDIGFVLLASVEPIRSKRQFTFPIYTGLGYKLNAEDFFFIFGPGIQVQF